MNHLDKIEFTVYLKPDKKYSFFNHMEAFKNEDISDLFIFHKDKVMNNRDLVALDELGISLNGCG